MRRGGDTLLLSGFPGVDYEQTVIDLIDDCSPDNGELFDLCYAENLEDPFRPLWLKLKPGSGIEFCEVSFLCKSYSFFYAVSFCAVDFLKSSTQVFAFF
jgi:hypothetical protein